jgi:hypothetical protein
VNLDNDENLFNNFNLEIENLKSDEGVIFLLDERTYQLITPEIIKCKKKGYRVVNSSFLLQTIK